MGRVTADIDMRATASATPKPGDTLTIVRLAKGLRVPGTPYRIEEWIAEGGMGAVYRARHVDIDRVVALKVLHGSGRDREAIEQLRREARITAGIDAPNIVLVYDFLRMPDRRVAMAMEMLDGQTLREALDEGKPLTPARTIAIVRQVCRGLAAAHEAGLVHLDIKPENIMLCRRDGRPDFVKLLDFGIASALGEAERGQVVGTAAYVSPDRLGDDALDGRTDLYSLGCVAFEMLTGRVPFDGDIMTVMTHHVETPPPSASEVNAAVPEGLGALVRRCMAKVPAERPADASDLEAALCEVQIEAGLVTDWDDLPLPPVDSERRAYLLEHMPRPEHARERESRRGWWVAAVAVGLLLVLAAVMGLRDESPSAGVQAQERVDELATLAYAAAAKTFYVYPPVDEPQADTAYTVLRELDALGTEQPAAQERAGTLRSEFADALVRLGDHYWDEPGGRSFAIDYYAQALMFDSTQPRAKERGMLSVGQSNELRRKAEERSFSEADLVSVAPLVVLAMDDEQQRNDALEQLVDEDERSPRVREELSRLAGYTPEAGSPERRAERRANRGPTRADGDDRRPAEEVDEPEQASVGDVQTAQTLVARARAAARAGRAKQSEKLFNRALKADPNNLGALVGLGNLHFEAGNYTESARHRRAATQRAPRNAGLRIGLGDALLKTFRYDDAMAEYEQAAKLGHSAAADRIARLEKKMGRR